MKDPLQLNQPVDTLPMGFALEETDVIFFTQSLRNPNNSICNSLISLISLNLNKLRTSTNSGSRIFILFQPPDIPTCPSMSA